MNISIEKGYIPGCIGRISELHAQYYSNWSGLAFLSKPKWHVKWLNSAAVTMISAMGSGWQQ